MPKGQPNCPVEALGEAAVADLDAADRGGRRPQSESSGYLVARAMAPKEGLLWIPRDFLRIRRESLRNS